MSLSSAQCETLIELARSTIRHALEGGIYSPPPIEDESLHAPAGCFVTLHELGTHRLRGCIGRLDAYPLWRAVVSSATDVLDDPRFQSDPVTPAELPRLEIEISILSPMRPAATPLDFDPQNDGIYLIVAERSGCFLPQVGRETGWTREQLLDRLCTEKLGFEAHAWRAADASLQTFSTQTIGPEPLHPIDLASEI